MIRYVASLVLLMNLSRAGFAQRINTEAAQKFWQVVDGLQAGHPLDDSLWNGYYNLPGNRTYMQNNRDLEQVLEYRKYLELVFRPSLGDSLRTLEASPAVATDDILDNLLYVRAHEEALRSYSTRVASAAYLQACIRLAKHYIPKNKIKPIPENFTIYIMVMTFDAAVQDSSMYFGLTRVFEYDKFRIGAVAGHEMQHQLRDDRALLHRVSAADSAVFSAVDDINNEGSADLIDKMLLLEKPGQIFRGTEAVHRLMNPAPRAIVQLDSCFRVNAAEGQSYVTARQFNRILNYSSGHMPGLYMASIIKRNGLEARLISHDDNPFWFFYIYNEAARKDPGRPPVFSGATIDYLRRLDELSL